MCFLSDASEREEGHSGGGVGADGHRLSAWGIRLPEERWGDVERRRLCQQRGAGGRHTGEATSNHNKELEPGLSVSTTSHTLFPLSCLRPMSCL